MMPAHAVRVHNPKQGLLLIPLVKVVFVLTVHDNFTTLYATQ